MATIPSQISVDIIITEYYCPQAHRSLVRKIFHMGGNWWIPNLCCSNDNKPKITVTMSIKKARSAHTSFRCEHFFSFVKHSHFIFNDTKLLYSGCLSRKRWMKLLLQKTKCLFMMLPWQPVFSFNPDFSVSFWGHTHSSTFLSTCNLETLQWHTFWKNLAVCPLLCKMWLSVARFLCLNLVSMWALPCLSNPVKTGLRTGLT